MNEHNVRYFSFFFSVQSLLGNIILMVQQRVKIQLESLSYSLRLLSSRLEKK